MKYILALIVCLSICQMTDAKADSSITGREEAIVRGGIKADAVFLNFLKKNAPRASSSFTPRGQIGGFASIEFTEWIGIQPEFNLNYKNTLLSWSANSGRMNSLGIEIPIYVTTGWDVFKNDRLYVGLGPYTEFCYYAMWHIDDRDVNLLKVHKDGEPMIKDTQSGFAGIFGYRFGCGLGIHATYKICCYNFLQPNTSQGVSLYPQTFSVGLSYYFKSRTR